MTYSHVLKDHHDRLGLQARPIELHNVAIKAQATQQLHLLQGTSSPLQNIAFSVSTNGKTLPFSMISKEQNHCGFSHRS